MNPVVIIRVGCIALAAFGGYLAGVGVHYGIEEPLLKRLERRGLADIDSVRYQPVAPDDDQERLDRIEEQLREEEAR